MKMKIKIETPTVTRTRHAILISHKGEEQVITRDRETWIVCGRRVGDIRIMGEGITLTVKSREGEFVYAVNAYGRVFCDDQGVSPVVGIIVTAIAEMVMAEHKKAMRREARALKKAQKEFAALEAFYASIDGPTIEDTSCSREERDALPPWYIA